MEGLVIVCHGGCGKTTDEVNNAEFWQGKVEQVEGTLVPLWTCKECQDICLCGDYRHQHENGAGRCLMPDDLCHGFEPCLEFRLAK